MIIQHHLDYLTCGRHTISLDNQGVGINEGWFAVVSYGVVGHKTSLDNTELVSMGQIIEATLCIGRIHMYQHGVF